MNDTNTFEQLAATKPLPVVPYGEARYLIWRAIFADEFGDTAARTYWLERFQAHLDDNAS